MKTINVTILLVNVFCNICFSQVLGDYPFKTLLDADNNLLLTGNKFNPQTNSINIIVESYNNNGVNRWSKFIDNFFGNDRGLDLALDHDGNVVICGYIYDNQSNSNDAIIIKLDGLTGDTIWTRKVISNLDDKLFGVKIDQNNNICVSGFLTNLMSGNNFFVSKYYRNGTPLWQYTSSLPGDDVATDIVVDENFAYVIGYQTESNGINTDIKFMSFDLDSGAVTDNLIHERPEKNEMPVEFLISLPPDAQRLKSRIAVVSVTDQTPVNSNNTRYLTLYLEEDPNHKLEVRWSDILRSPHAVKRSMPTAMTKNNAGDFFVTGYMDAARNINIGTNRGLDFATTKYRAATGAYGWKPNNIVFNNYNDTSTTGVNDRASSIKINNREVIYVAGMSDGSPNGFSIAEFRDEDDPLSPVKQRAFVPNFLNVDRGDKLNKWAKLELTSDGTPLMIVMAWGEFEVYWAAIKYDAHGNIEYTINNEPESDGSTESKVSESPEVTALKNYPNPFNPTTQLEFGISDLGFVTLKVYDMLGKEVAVLVNEKKSGGIHTVSFDGSGLSSGMYYYTLSVNGKRMETKSMVLMK